MSDHRASPRTQRVVAAALLAIGLAAVAPVPVAPLPSSAVEARVNINTADAHELQLLPGLGPALAARVAHDRALHGPFTDVDELTRVRGIGARTVRALRGFAAVDD